MESNAQRSKYARIRLYGRASEEEPTWIASGSMGCPVGIVGLASSLVVAGHFPCVRASSGVVAASASLSPLGLGDFVLV
jgi:hypothetical protein